MAGEAVKHYFSHKNLPQITRKTRIQEQLRTLQLIFSK